ncbi:DpnD/PcfM family protein [Anaerosporobacter sp.]
MKTYAIRIEEVLAKTVLIDAEDLDSAIERVSELYQNGEIEVESMDDSNVIPSPYADIDGVYQGTEEEKLCYEIVEKKADLILKTGGMKMGYLFTETIEKCISDCIEFGNGEYKEGLDSCGDPLVWVSTEWVEHDNKHDVVLLYIRNTDTGSIRYSTKIMETLTEKYSTSL